MANVAIDPAMRRRVVWSSTIGNALEWFDFIVFGLFAGVIGELFFPPSDPTAQLVRAYGLFAVAYLFRPIGGLVFGVWSDRIGRKRALISIVLMMALGSGLIGIMPTYQTIGAAAPIGLIVARLIQGFSAGGEYSTSTAMLLEFAPRRRRGFYAAFQHVAQFSAFVIGAAFFYGLKTFLSPDAFAGWGWRVPFLAGIVIGPVGVYLRSAIDETPEFRALLERLANRPNTPLRDVLRQYPRSLFALLLYVAGGTAFTYIMNIYLPTYAQHNLSLSATDATLGLLVVNVVAAMAIPFAGGLSDSYGRRAVMVPALILFIIASLFLAEQVIREPSNVALWALQTTSLIMIFVTGPGNALTMETFPVQMRSTGAAIVYNVAVAIFGGLSPWFVTRLTEATGDKFMPFYYMDGCLILSLIGLAILPGHAAGAAQAPPAVSQREGAESRDEARPKST
jgi:MHS family proline/betaine transporter-like MFS transporter